MIQSLEWSPLREVTRKAGYQNSRGQLCDLDPWVCLFVFFLFLKVPEARRFPVLPLSSKDSPKWTEKGET